MDITFTAKLGYYQNDGFERCILWVEPNKKHLYIDRNCWRKGTWVDVYQNGRWK